MKPLEDWEKALCLTAIAEGQCGSPSRGRLAIWLLRLTDWNETRADAAIAEAHLKGMIAPYGTTQS